MDKNLHQPLGGNEMPRFGGIATMMRLPHVQSPPNSTPSMPPSSACPRHRHLAALRYPLRPREIRAESVMIRPYNMATGAAPSTR